MNLLRYVASLVRTELHPIADTSNRYTLAQLLWVVAFAAAASTASIDPHTPVLALTLLLTLTLAVKGKTHARLGLKILLPSLSIGCAIGVGLSKLPAVTLHAWIAGLLLLLGSISFIGTFRQNTHPTLSLAILAYTWTVLAIDPAPAIGETYGLTVQTAASVLGMAASLLLIKWHAAFAGSVLLAFWVLQLSLVAVNAEAGMWGVGWYNSWIS